MPLTLTLREREGFYIGDRRWSVARIAKAGVWIRSPEGREYRVTDQEAIEVQPDVRVSDGFVTHYGMARLVFNAPRSIVILREELREPERR